MGIFNLANINIKIKNVHKIIKAASKTKLGFSGLVITILGLVALVFFYDDPFYVQMPIYFAILTSLLLFAYAVILSLGRMKPAPETRPLAASGEELKASHAAAVCYRRFNEQTEYLLVRSRGGRLRFPKGKRQPGESLRATAKRKASHEGGVKGDVSKEILSTYWHQKGSTNKGYTVAVFLIEVVQKGSPKKNNTKPKWCSFSKAEAELSEKRKPDQAKELLRVLRYAHSKIQDSS